MDLPQTVEEWQEAVNAARALLALDAAREYGLVTGGPVFDVKRAAEILDLGKARGITPTDDAVEQFVASLNDRGRPAIPPGINHVDPEASEDQPCRTV